MRGPKGIGLLPTRLKLDAYLRVTLHLDLLQSGGWIIVEAVTYGPTAPPAAHQDPFQ